MRVSLFSTYDSGGGAARAVDRLHRGLREIGVDARLVVQCKYGNAQGVEGPSTRVGRALAQAIPALDSVPARFYRNREKRIFSPAVVPSGRILKESAAADVVNLHWVAGGFARIEAIAKIPKPMVVTLHDAWAFTGGCHYPFDCERYLGGCGRCPQLRSSWKYDLSHWVWRRKEKHWKMRPFAGVAVSRWLAERARGSPLLSGRIIETIPPGLDLRVYRPLDKRAARDALALPADARIVMFGAMHAGADRNKGYHLLRPALARVAAGTLGRTVHFLILGGEPAPDPAELGTATHSLGRLHDDVSLALANSAADVVVVPSVQEAFGQTASEALACGTPVVAFGATGLLDIVDHMKNGYLAKPFDVEDLAHGIEWVLEDRERWQWLSRAAREKCERSFDVRDVAQRYATLYAAVASGAVA